MASTSKPAVVLAHGAWHTGAHFSNVLEKLESAGCEVTAPNMPSTSGSIHSDSMHEDSAILRHTIETLTNKGKDVVIVMHSYGGEYGSEAVAEWHLDPKNAEPGKGRIVHLFYISALIFPADITLIEDNNTFHVLSLEDGLLHNMEPFHRFYEHVPLPIARKCMAQLRPQDASSFAARTKYRGWADYDIPVTYLACKQDKALVYDPDLLKFSGRIRDAGVKEFDFVEMDTDHTPWLSREEEFMALMFRVLGKVEGNAGAKM